MDVRGIVSTDIETFDADAHVSELEGFFRETGAKVVVVTEDGEYEGIVSRRQLHSAHRLPDTKARRLVQHVATVDVDDDVRAAARKLMGSAAPTLPVFEDDELLGLVTVDDLLAAVQPFLRVLTVDDVYNRELVTVAPETTIGEVLHELREHRISHLPVVDDGDPVGIVGIYDLLEFTTREMQRAQGGSPATEIQTGGDRSHGGFGERAGELDRMLDLPVEDAMVGPAEPTTPGARLDDAVGTMLEAGISSLVVTDDDGDPVGIVTETDVLRALTWTEETHVPVQITNADLLDDVTREEVAAMIESVTRKYGDLNVLEANVFLHEHDETLRGTPLIAARIRLFSDRGHFVGTGEGYGAGHALRLARNVVEREILEGKEYGRTKKHPPQAELSKLFGWWLTGSPRRR